MKKLVKKIPLAGLVIIILIISISAQATVLKKEEYVQKNLGINENIVADVSLEWDSFLHRFSFKDLDPVVTIYQHTIKDYYFPEINGTIPQINFTVTCKHHLLYPVLFPRSTWVHLAILYNDTPIFLQESEKHPCKTQEWEYINFTAVSDGAFEPLVTNGESITLILEVGAYGSFFGLRGDIQLLEPITIHPI